MARSRGLRPFVFALQWSAVTVCLAATAKFDLELRAGDQDRHASPVAVQLLVPADFAKATQAVVSDGAGKALAAQLTAPSLLAPNVETDDKATVQRELHFIVDDLPKEATVHWTAVIGADVPDAVAAAGFQWQDTPGDHADLLYGDRTLLRYMYHAIDLSTPVRRVETYKVFHHVFDPTGSTLLTKGVGGDFTHHRGLFFGFNKVTYDGAKQCDVWHCKDPAFQSHDGFLETAAGAVLGRQRLAIGWHGLMNDVFANEQRELTVYRPAGGTGMLIEFASRVCTTSGPVALNGDPQHAGFHFRAVQEVSEQAKAKMPQTYYIRPDGVGKVGETRNWDPNKSYRQVDFPWKGMSVLIGGQRYTIGYLDSPKNPKEARFSERDYGRFGSYFEYMILPDHPLEVNYRVWVQPGEMQPDQLAALDDDFVRPIEVIVKSVSSND